jgi:hypothetical protein
MIVENDRVRGSQVDTKTTCTCTEKEDKDVGADNPSSVNAQHTTVS